MFSTFLIKENNNIFFLNIKTYTLDQTLLVYM